MKLATSIIIIGLFLQVGLIVGFNLIVNVVELPQYIPFLVITFIILTSILFCYAQVRNNVKRMSIITLILSIGFELEILLMGLFFFPWLIKDAGETLSEKLNYILNYELGAISLNILLFWVLYLLLSIFVFFIKKLYKKYLYTHSGNK